MFNILTPSFSCHKRQRMMPEACEYAFSSTVHVVVFSGKSEGGGFQGIFWHYLTLLSGFCHDYRPRSEASEGYVFTGICHSVQLGGCVTSNVSWDRLQGQGEVVLSWGGTSTSLKTGHLPPPPPQDRTTFPQGQHQHPPPPQDSTPMTGPPPPIRELRAVRILLDCIFVFTDFFDLGQQTKSFATCQ